MELAKYRTACILGISLAVLGGFILLMITGGTPHLARNAEGPNLEASNSRVSYEFGNPPSNYTGWQIPPGELIETTFIANKTLNGFVSATVYTFHYPAHLNGSLYLGLYFNGQLVSNQSYLFAESVGPPVPIGHDLRDTPGERLATFSPYLEGYSVTAFLKNPVPAGTQVTVSILATSPTWVQTGGKSSTSSRAMGSLTPIPNELPNTLMWALTPYPLNIQVESNA